MPRPLVARAGLLLACLAVLFLSRAAGAEAVRIAEGGDARLSVVVLPQASPGVRETAATLAKYLGRISGGEFQVKEGDGRRGILLALVENHPDAELEAAVARDKLGGREAYRLRSRAAGLQIIGATEAAVRNGAWDLLHRLGHRQFFPGDHWEIVPRKPDLAIEVDAVEVPDYCFRRVWYGYGTWAENRPRYDRWRVRNRMAGEFDLHTGHAYGGLIRAYQDEFDEHPEYYALVDGERRVAPEAKLCVSNPAVRRLMVEHALRFFEENPEAETVSVEPSDGGGWCECDKCAAIGAPSDLALTLANEVSRALEEKYPKELKFAALYAYNQHGPPPKIEARPRVIVNVATAFLRGGWTPERIIAGWRDRGVRRFGIREYYSVLPWDHDLPGRARGSQWDYLRDTIPRFHEMGARFLTAESSENWGPNGLGYYFASRMMWDVTEAERLDELFDDFLRKAFGPAAKPMRSFYELLHGPQAKLLSEDLVGRMYRCLDEAGRATADARIRARLDDLILYTRYVELYRAYDESSKAERPAKLEALIRHSYRMRDTCVVHSYAQYRTGFRDRVAKIPEAANYRVPEEKNPWKSSRPWTREELDRLVAEGVASNALRQFRAVDYGDDLVPAAPLRLASKKPLSLPTRGRGAQLFYVWIDRAGQTVALRVTGGLIEHYRDRGPAKVELQVWDGDQDKYVTVSKGETEPDGVDRVIPLTAQAAGLHRVRVSDGSDMTQVLWPDGLRRVAETNPAHANRFSGRASYYFYVPQGVKTLGGYLASARGTLHDPTGAEVAAFDGASRFFHVAVPPDQSGKLWSVRNLAGTLQLMTVPPYIASSPEAMLLPRKVVEADRARE